MVNTFAVFTPRFNFPAVTMLRIISPAPINRTTERATSAPTKIFVSNRRRTPTPWRLCGDFKLPSVIMIPYLDEAKGQKWRASFAVE
jgi:hypothetical protein